MVPQLWKTKSLFGVLLLSWLPNSLRGQLNLEAPSYSRVQALRLSLSPFRAVLQAWAVGVWPVELFSHMRVLAFEKLSNLFNPVLLTFTSPPEFTVKDFLPVHPSSARRVTDLFEAIISNFLSDKRSSWPFDSRTPLLGGLFPSLIVGSPTLLSLLKLYTRSYTPTSKPIRRLRLFGYYCQSFRHGIPRSPTPQQWRLRLRP